MGVDFSVVSRERMCGCSYVGFNDWRRKICVRANLGALDDYVGFGGDKQFPDHDLTPLLNHSDCDGVLSHAGCVRIARGLRELDTTSWLPHESDFTERFLAMLDAVQPGQWVEFS